MSCICYFFSSFTCILSFSPNDTFWPSCRIIFKPSCADLNQTNSGTGMITGRRITGREAAAEVRVDMKRNGIVAGIGIIAVEVGAEAEITVLVIGITETVEEAKMMMRGVVEVGLMGVLPLLDVVLVPGGAHLRVKQLQGVEVQMLSQLQRAVSNPQKFSPPRRGTDSRSPTPRSDADE
ncbi:uncharacterized protein LOC111376392 [Olea europaea var. sylvestris]|uniref:uncharacterized protein LOC111376392 n=1 Tax=Olea europaea var. sylvestris TaxID=158386 RepID=UPI000C1D7D47|nr:uncharacterized protein LOC111376392 [Olea europaea var. sylvestris]